MMEQAWIVSTDELLHYLGVGDDEAEYALVDGMRAAAVERLACETTADCEQDDLCAVFNEAVRVYLWMGYYAVRGACDNAAFLQEYLSGLLTVLSGEGA